jgi:hypothetical protein
MCNILIVNDYKQLIARHYLMWGIWWLLYDSLIFSLLVGVISQILVNLDNSIKTRPHFFCISENQVCHFEDLARLSSYFSCDCLSISFGGALWLQWFPTFAPCVVGPFYLSVPMHNRHMPICYIFFIYHISRFGYAMVPHKYLHSLLLHTFYVLLDLGTIA